MQWENREIKFTCTQFLFSEIAKSNTRETPLPKFREINYVRKL